MSLFEESPTVEQIQFAVNALRCSLRGLDALQNLDRFACDGGCYLDGNNQCAVVTVLFGLWGPYAGTTWDWIRQSNRKPDEVPQSRCEHDWHHQGTYNGVPFYVCQSCGAEKK